jgi:hypothetical protein
MISKWVGSLVGRIIKKALGEEGSTGAALRSELGFQARPEEVRRFGHRAKKIIHQEPRKVDSRSFAKVVKEGMMSYDQGMTG